MTTYNETSIDHLEDLEAIRKRPELYIGEINEHGPMRLLNELIDNGVDEHMAGMCNKIIIAFELDGSISVEDNGRGIPVGMHQKHNISTLELIFTKLHAGGKFGQGGYTVSGGLHGLGVKCVNALSEYCKVVVWREDGEHSMDFIRGKVNTLISSVPINNPEKHGTKIYFKADPQMFPVCGIDPEKVALRLKELAYLNPGLKMVLQRANGVEEFCYDGIPSYFDEIFENKTAIHVKLIDFLAEREGFSFRAVARYNDTLDYSGDIFVNNIPAHLGSHMNGFKTGYIKALNAFVADQKSKDIRLCWEDIAEGLVLVFAMNMAEPRFAAQTKERLSNPEIESPLAAAVYEKMSQFLEMNPKIGNSIIAKCTEAAKARIAARKRKSAIKKASSSVNAGVPPSLYDGNGDDKNLYLCIGDGVFNKLSKNRNKDKDALLELKTKFPNPEKTPLEKLMDNTDIFNIICSVGAGVGLGEEDGSFDITKSRYKEIIIVGNRESEPNIAKLLGFIKRYMNPILVNGRVGVFTLPSGISGILDIKAKIFSPDTREIDILKL